MLGLGIGAPTTVFTLVNQLFFVRPAEVMEPHRLVKMYGTHGDRVDRAMEHPDFEYYRRAATSLELAAYSEGGIDAPYSLSPGEYDQLTPGFVSDNYVDVLGTRALIGRGFLPEENATPGTHAVLVLSHPFWHRAFASDPDVVGRTLLIADRPYTILGVMPETFAGISPLESPPDVWLPIAMHGDLFADPSDRAWWERMPGRSST